MQKSVFAEIAFRAKLDERWLYIFAVPNGQYRPGQRMEPGIMPGVPDIFWPLPRHGFNGIAIELKVGRNQTTPDQDRWLSWLKIHNYFTRVVYDYPEEVMTLLDWYFLGEESGQ